MINLDNGNIQLIEFKTIIQSDNFTIADLKQTDFHVKKFYQLRDMETGYIWYDYQPISLHGYSVYFNLCFYHGKLDSIHFGTTDQNDPTSWDDWTEEQEMAIYRRNNQFITKLTSQKLKKRKKPYPFAKMIFCWGSIWSCYDPRSCSSFAGISYPKK